MTARGPRRSPARVERPREEVRAALGERLGLRIDAELLELALVHRSWAYEHGGVATNERLEFLGDAVLGLVVTDELYHRHPDLPEGQLAKLRAAVVNMRALARVAASLDLGECVLLGHGEEVTGGRRKASILADTTEAVIGAAYLSAGADAARALVLRLVAQLLEDSAELGAALDWKTSLQELVAAHGLGQVEYASVAVGPDHAKSFQARVRLAEDAGGPASTGDDRTAALVGVVTGASTGAGASKKEAEQAAAQAAWRALSARVAPAGPRTGAPA